MSLEEGAGIKKEVKRRADVAGIFPDGGSIIRLIGAVQLETNDEWQTQHRYMQTEPMADHIGTTINTQAVQITAQAT